MNQDISQFLDLNHNPFTPATTREEYFHTEETRQILEEFLFGIQSRKGFLLLIGEVGVGKTSLLLQLLDKMESDQSLNTSWVFNTYLDRIDLLRSVATDFGLQIDPQAHLSSIIDELHRYFLQANNEGYNCAIVIDEAHNLSPEGLESLRMLSNLEGEQTKLVQILLAGQPELETLLRRSQLRQLRSRIYISRILHPLGKEDTYRYVTFKLSAAKSQLRLPQSSLRLLWEACRGNIRLINLIMDRALHLLVVRDSRRLSPGVLRAAIQDISEYQRGIKSSLKRARFRRVALTTAIVVLLLLGSFYTLNALKIDPFHRYFQNHFVFQGNAGHSQGGQSSAARQEIRHVFPAENQTQNRTQGSAAKQSQNRSQTQNRTQGTAAKQSQNRNQTSQVADRNASSAPQNKENATVASSSSDKAITRFLKPYELTGLQDTLNEAIEQKNATLIRDRLPDSVGLLGLEKLPEQKAIPFTALSWKDRTGKDPEWIALWRPLLRVEKKFPNQAEEDDILLLQKMLQELGFYNGTMDGMFGQETLRSVDAFQEAHGLSRTHGPDPQTLFWICNTFELARKEQE